MFQRQPLEATRLGEHRFDGELDDLRPAARAAWLACLRQTLDELPRAVDFAGLSPAAKVDFQIFRDMLRRSIWVEENTRRFQDDPRVYNDYITESVYLPLTQSTCPKETSIANAIARMGRIPSVVAAARQNLRHPSRVATETAIRQNRGAIAFYRGDILTLAGQTPQAAAAGGRSGPQGLSALPGKRPAAAGRRAQWRLGKEKFARKLDLELDAGLTADEVLAAGRGGGGAGASRYVRRRPPALESLPARRDPAAPATRPGGG